MIPRCKGLEAIDMRKPRASGDDPNVESQAGTVFR